MPYEIVDKFERTIAEWAGSSFAVSVESGSAAIFLSLLYCKNYWGGKNLMTVSIPKYTYPSVPCSIINAGGQVKFKNIKWSGTYRLEPYPIIDSALRFRKGMYEKKTLYCISFHAKKHLPIGRGGMILTDSKWAYHWLKKARFDGRSDAPLYNDKLDIIGWNMYMTPEQASRGLQLFNFIKDKDIKDLDFKEQKYPDLSKVEAYKI